MELIDRLIAAQEQRDACIAYADKLTKQRDALLAALKAVEWVDDWRQCPWCKNVEADGHKLDCQRQAAIAAVEGEK